MIRDELFKLLIDHPLVLLATRGLSEDVREKRVRALVEEILEVFARLGEVG